MFATLEDQNEVIVRMDLPDVNNEDLKVTVEKDVVSIIGKIKTQRVVDEFGKEVIERETRKFYKEIPIPQRVNPKDVSYKFEEGMLEIKMPRLQAEKIPEFA